MSDTRLEAALQGDLRAFMEDELDLAERAVTAGMRATGNRLKTALRQDVVSGGLGRRLSRNWRQKDYPEHGASLSAASLVSANAPELMRAFDEGVTARAANSRFLAIPTDAAPKLGSDRKRLTPNNFPEHRYGPLRFVYRPGRASLLVVDSQRERKGKRGGYTRSRSKRALKSGHGLVTVAMFLLVPQVRLRRRLKVKAVTDAVSAGLAGDIDTAFQALKRRRR